MIKLIYFISGSQVSSVNEPCWDVSFHLSEDTVELLWSMWANTHCNSSLCFTGSDRKCLWFSVSLLSGPQGGSRCSAAGGGAEESGCDVKFEIPPPPPPRGWCIRITLVTSFIRMTTIFKHTGMINNSTMKWVKRVMRVFFWKYMGIKPTTRWTHHVFPKQQNRDAVW